MRKRFLCGIDETNCYIVIYNRNNYSLLHDSQKPDSREGAQEIHAVFFFLVFLPDAVPIRPGQQLPDHTPGVPGPPSPAFVGTICPLENYIKF